MWIICSKNIKPELVKNNFMSNKDSKCLFNEKSLDNEFKTMEIIKMATKVFEKGSSVDEFLEFWHKQKIAYAVRGVWAVLEANNISLQDIEQGRWETNFPEIIELKNIEIFGPSELKTEMDISFFQDATKHAIYILKKDFISNGVLKQQDGFLEVTRFINFPDHEFLEMFLGLDILNLDMISNN
jgi:hypothetical protein